MHAQKAGADTRFQLSARKPDKYLKRISVLISNLKIPVDTIQSSMDSSIFFKSITGPVEAEILASADLEEQWGWHLTTGRRSCVCEGPAGANRTVIIGSERERADFVLSATNWKPLEGCRQGLGFDFCSRKIPLAEWKGDEIESQRY